MEINDAAHQLRHQGEAILALAADLQDSAAQWKPNAESWSILEVLNHLVDEEILDFRRHLEYILDTPDQPWPQIDPQGWVTEKNYNQRSLEETVINFKSERERSITWLLALNNPDWESAVTRSWGKLTAGDMLASWLAHDLLHLRQLVALFYDLTARESQPYSVQYAGEW